MTAAVFALTPAGLALREVAPGIDIQADILDRMGPKPAVDDVREMDRALLLPEGVT